MHTEIAATLHLVQALLRWLVNHHSKRNIAKALARPEYADLREITGQIAKNRWFALQTDLKE